MPQPEQLLRLNTNPVVRADFYLLQGQSMKELDGVIVSLVVAYNDEG